MPASISEIIVLFIAAIAILLIPFTPFIIAKKDTKSSKSGFFSGILSFVLAFIAYGLIWSVMEALGIIETLLGTVDVDRIKATIDEVLYVLSICLFYYLYVKIQNVISIKAIFVRIGSYIKRIIGKKPNKIKTKVTRPRKNIPTPYSSLRHVGGYMVIEAVFLILIPYILLPLMVILSNGRLEFKWFFETIKLSELDINIWNILFKVFRVLAHFIVNCVAILAIYAAKNNDAKWLYPLAPVLMLALRLPYKYSSLNSRKLTKSTVVIVDIFWKSPIVTAIVMFLAVILAAIVGKIIYNNHYRTEARKAEIKAKREARKEKRLAKKTER